MVNVLAIIFQDPCQNALQASLQFENFKLPKFAHLNAISAAKKLPKPERSASTRSNAARKTRFNDRCAVAMRHRQSGVRQHLRYLHFAVAIRVCKRRLPKPARFVQHNQLVKLNRVLSTRSCSLMLNL